MAIGYILLEFCYNRRNGSGKSSDRQIFNLRRYLEFQTSKKNLFEPGQFDFEPCFPDSPVKCSEPLRKNVGSPPLCHISPKQVCIG